MTSQDRLGAALERLAAALDQLEATSARHVEACAGRDAAARAPSHHESDRSRIDAKLERTEARSVALEQAHDEALVRVKRAEAAIRTVLARNGIRGA